MGLLRPDFPDGRTGADPQAGDGTSRRGGTARGAGRPAGHRSRLRVRSGRDHARPRASPRASGRDRRLDRSSGARAAERLSARRRRPRRFRRLRLDEGPCRAAIRPGGLESALRSRCRCRGLLRSRRLEPATALFAGKDGLSEIRAPLPPHPAWPRSLSSSSASASGTRSRRRSLARSGPAGSSRISRGFRGSASCAGALGRPSFRGDFDRLFEETHLTYGIWNRYGYAKWGNLDVLADPGFYGLMLSRLSG
jgi:hypothetical protein